MYGMRKTTVYLPEDLKAAIERLAARTQRSEAEVIRDALLRAVVDRTPPKPTLPLSSAGLGDPTLAERVDEALEGFGTS